MSFVSNFKHARNNVTALRNENIANLKKLIEQEKRDADTAREEIKAEECRIMNEIIEAASGDTPLTAREIANKVGSNVSAYEVAGNLYAMDPDKFRHHQLSKSRFEHTIVQTPRKNSKCVERDYRIRHRYFVETDEFGTPLENAPVHTQKIDVKTYLITDNPNNTSTNKQ